MMLDSLGSLSDAATQTTATTTTRDRLRIETSQGNAPYESYSRLIIDKADLAHNGLYECEVTADQSVIGGSMSSDQHQAMLLLQQQPQSGASVANASGDKLRRLFGLLVNGK